MDRKCIGCIYCGKLGNVFIKDTSIHFYCERMREFSKYFEAIGDNGCEFFDGYRDTEDEQ